MWNRPLPADAPESDLAALVEGLNADPAVDGILVPLPLPPQMGERRVLDRIAPAKDVDGFHPVSVGRLWLDEPSFAPATPAGILELLRRAESPLVGRHAVGGGRSAIVGKPAAVKRAKATWRRARIHAGSRPAVARASRAKSN